MTDREARATIGGLIGIRNAGEVLHVTVERDGEELPPVPAALALRLPLGRSGLEQILAHTTPQLVPDR